MVQPIVAARPSLCPVVLPGTYEPRATTETVLHQVVRAHLDRFLADFTKKGRRQPQAAHFVKLTA
jgi:hypothetical protein